MPPTLAGKKKPSGRVQEVPSRPPSTEDSIYAPTGDPTPEDQSQTLPQSSATRDPRPEARVQTTDTIGGPIQLSDSQFRVLLERLATDPNFVILTIETPLIP